MAFLLKYFAKEGGSIQGKLFEIASYGNEDSAKKDVLMYRSLWNSSVNEPSFQRALIILSVLLEISERHYEATLLSIRDMMAEDETSKRELVRNYLDYLN